MEVADRDDALRRSGGHDRQRGEKHRDGSEDPIEGLLHRPNVALLTEISNDAQFASK
jgi:hypothetical protein